MKPADRMTSLYFDAPPLAVFSVLADLENRPRIIDRVKRTELKSPPPVGTGTRYREWRRSLAGSSGSVYEISAFTPPKRLTLVRRRFGTRLEAIFSLEEENAGTRLRLAVNGALPLWPGLPTGLLARRWKSRLDRDLADIKRHVGQRADPVWQQGLGGRRLSSSETNEQNRDRQ